MKDLSILFVGLSLVLGACSVMPKSTVIPATDVATATSTVTATETLTPEPTATATLEPTKTPELLNINTDLAIVDVSKLPLVSVSDVESGKLTDTILYLYTNGQIEKISSSAQPFIEKSLAFSTKSSGSVVMIDLSNGSGFVDQYSNFQTDPEARPYRAAAINAIEVEGKTLLLLSEVYINRNGTVGIVNYAIESYLIPSVADQIKQTLAGEYLPTPMLKLPASFNGFGWFAYGNEHAMLKYYTTQSEVDRLNAAHLWFDTGNIPAELSKMVLIPFMAPLR